MRVFRFKSFLSETLIVLMSMFVILAFVGCEFDVDEGDDDNKDENVKVGKVSDDIKGSIFGRVSNYLGKPLAKADIKLYGDATYSTKTDDDGYYRITDVKIGDYVTLFGTSENGSGSAEGKETVLNTRYEMVVSYDANEDGFLDAAKFRQQVAFNATIYKTGSTYFYETSPVNSNVMLSALGVLSVNVFTGKIDSNGDPVAASGAKLTLFPVAGGALVTQTPAATGVTNSDGKFVFDESYQLPATNGFILVIYPYDSNPAADDGFEFGTVVMNVDLSPYSYNPAGGSAVNPNYSLRDLTVNLAAQNTAGQDVPLVLFSHPRQDPTLNNLDRLDDSNKFIYLIFNRPLVESTFEYDLFACNGTCDHTKVAGQNYPNDLTDQRVYLVPEMMTPVIFKATIAAPTIPENNPYFFNFDAKSYEGKALNYQVIFEIGKNYDPEVIPIPKPYIDWAASGLVDQNGNMPLNHYGAVDFANVYVFDEPSLTNEGYLGPLMTLVEASPDPKGNVPANVGKTLPIRWQTIRDVSHFEVYMKDTTDNNEWIMVAEAKKGNGSYPTSDYTTSANIPFPRQFDYYSDDGATVQTPFCGNNEVLVGIIPVMTDGTRPNKVDANYAMALKDGWGPSVLKEAFGANFAGAATQFAGKDYGSWVDISLSEYPDASLEPAVTPDVSQAGVTIASGRFTIESIIWDTTTNYTSLRVKTVAGVQQLDQGNLYIGDKVDIDCTLAEIGKVGGKNYFRCVQDFANQVVTDSARLFGPVRAAADNERYLSNGQNNLGSIFVSDEITTLDNLTEYFKARPVSLSQSRGTEVARLFMANENDGQIVLEKEVAGEFGAGGTLSNIASTTIDGELVAPGSNADMFIKLSSLDGIKQGDILFISDSDKAKREAVRVDSIDEENSQVKLNYRQYTNAHASGTTVYLTPRTQLKEDFDPENGTTIVLEDVNSIGNGLGFRPGDKITVGDKSALITGVSNGSSQVSLSVDGLETTHSAGSVVSLEEKSVTLDGVRIALKDTNGMKPDVDCKVNGVVEDNSTGTAVETPVENDYKIVRVSNGSVLLNTSKGLSQYDNAKQDSIMLTVTTEKGTRPDDILKIQAYDNSGNPIQESKNELHGDGEVD